MVSERKLVDVDERTERVNTKASVWALSVFVFGFLLLGAIGRIRVAAEDLVILGLVSWLTFLAFLIRYKAITRFWVKTCLISITVAGVLAAAIVVLKK